MRASTLPTLHRLIGNGYQLRVEAAKAISSLEVYGRKGAPNTDAMVALKAFFVACGAAVDAIDLRIKSTVVTPNPVPSLSIAGVRTSQLVVTATRLNGTTANVAATSTYVSANPAVATVSATGLINGVTVGTTSVTVTDPIGVKTVRAVTVVA